MHPQFDRAAVVAWLLAHDKIGVPIGMPAATLTVVGPGRRTARFRLDGPHLVLAEDAAGEDVLSGWSTDEDAGALVTLTAGEFGAALGRLTVPLAVLDRVRVVERFRSGAGCLRVTLAGLPACGERPPGTGVWPITRSCPRPRAPAAGVCSMPAAGVTAVSWCPDHGPAEGRAVENHIEGGIHCAERARLRAPART
ncbi:hypothetical protein ACIPW5_06920 [Streptomyces sp. NPDC090077]|uniref:hypothetical protein n=1 Tax=Streptomyces sp. NPDC090077 TaxID=3365938 RepID=UPI00381CC3CF